MTARRGSAANPVVVFLAGSGRSGSTVLSAVLGQLDGWFAAGEVRYLWARGLQDRRRCGCGAAVPDCDVWSDVLERAFGRDGPDVQRAIAQQTAIDGLRNVPRPLLGAHARADLAAALADHPAALDRLYRAIAEVTGSRVIVDSSKLPTYGWVLSELTTLDVRVAHLVRDPRAAAYSWLRTKPRGDDEEGAAMHRQGPARSATLWAALNAAAARQWPRSEGHLRVRYEDFARDPGATVSSVARLADEDWSGGPPFVDHRTVDLDPTHTVAGNPDRLRSGRVTIRPDDEWTRSLAPRDRLVVSALTAPVRLALAR